VFSSLHHPRLRRILPLLILMVALVLVAPRLARYGVPRADAADSHVHASMPMNMNMSDEEMRAFAMKYAATHPNHVSGPVRLASVLDAPVDSFTAQNFQFDNDHNLGTQVDTAHIQVGQAIRFHWNNGFHSVLNGTGSTDPNSGTLFAHNLFSSTDNFDLVFTEPGTIPFWCDFHESFNMKGAIVVTAAVSVPPGNGAAIGFVSALTPNPATHGVSFRFALAKPGHTRVDVFDAQGRRVATPIEADYEPGTHSGAWNGLDARGAHVNPGVYTLRLQAPGIDQSRQLVFTR
jgi:plastocyanin